MPFIAIGPTAADLEVIVEGLRSSEGNVRVALHGRQDAVEFPYGQGIAGIFRRAQPERVRAAFADLLPGGYAVAAFHDADGNGELPTNNLWIPIEGHGFSNDARGLMGPPGFDACSRRVPHGPVGRGSAPAVDPESLAARRFVIWRPGLAGLPFSAATPTCWWWAPPTCRFKSVPQRSAPRVLASPSTFSSIPAPSCTPCWPAATASPAGYWRRAGTFSEFQPRPTNGIFVAITVRNSTLASSGSPAM